MKKKTDMLLIRVGVVSMNIRRDNVQFVSISGQLLHS